MTINRPQVRNAVDGEAGREPYEAFAAFDTNDELSVAVLTGGGASWPGVGSLL